MNTRHRPWRILVEARRDENHRQQLDLIAETLESDGYQVVRWRGPHSGRVPYGRRIVNCDLAILCNGTTAGYRDVLGHLRRRGIDTLFLELGWYPQSKTIQLDPLGINADASWVSETLVYKSRTPLALRPARDLLVLLQHEQDTQITCQSPHFREMSAFIEHLRRHSAMPLRIRQHPKFPAGPDVSRIAAKHDIALDRYPTLQQSLKHCRAVACINSSGAVEALAHRLPVLCFGRAVYRQTGAVYCMGPRGSEVARVTRDLASGYCRLSTEAVDAMVQRIVERQWTRETILDRLLQVVESIFEKRDAPRTRGVVDWIDHLWAVPTVLTTYAYPKLKRPA